MKSIWASSLNGKFKAQATNVWALSMLRYYLAVLNWSNKDLLVMDRMVWNEMRRSKNHHKSASVHLPRYVGGRGIPSLIHEREREVVSTAAYLISSTDPLLEAVVMHQRNLPFTRHSVIRMGTGIMHKYNTGVEITTESLSEMSLTPRKLSRLVRTHQIEEFQESHCAKKVHGVYYKTVKELDQKRSYMVESWQVKKEVLKA